MSGPGRETRVGRATLLVLPIAVLSRGAAFLVPLVIAMWFGVGVVTDAWYWALAFPTFTLVLANASLGTAATPAVARVRERAPDRLPHFAGGLLLWSGASAGAFGLAVALLAPTALAHLTDFPVETRALAQAYLWELVPFMVLNATGTVFRVVCEVHGRFAGVAATPLLRAAVVVGVTWALLGPLGPHALPWGLVAGEAAQVAWWAALARRAGVRPRPALGLGPELRAIGRDLAPILGGEVMVALNPVVDKGFAAWLPTGSVATLEFADRTRVIPQTVLESTLLMVAYATWANLHARGRRAEARRAVDQSLRWVLALTAPPLAGLFIGRYVLVRLVYERGAFSAADTAATAGVLAWYLPGVLPNLLGILAVRAHVVERNLRLVFALGIASVLANAAFNALLVGAMGLRGLALATTLNMTLIPGLYLYFLRDRLSEVGGGLGPWARALGVGFGAAVLAALVELGPGAPRSFADPVLWESAAASLALLGLGWRLGRGARP